MIVLVLNWLLLHFSTEQETKRGTEQVSGPVT